MGQGNRQDKARQKGDALFGKKAEPPRFVGAHVLQPVAALEAFVRSAAAGNEFVYCEAPNPMYGETWSRAGELAQAGIVRTHERQRAGGGRQYFVVRTGRALPKQVSPPDKVLADRATAAIFVQLKREANLGAPCSSDSELARLTGLNSRAQAQWRVRELIRVGLIKSEQAYEGGIPTRVVTIAAGKHAGGAAGKFTALPRKWKALRQAAERELRDADEADIDRLRRAGL